MRRLKPGKPGYAKILEAWEPPEDAGEAVGCVATTFTFDAAFFEEQCLGRFVQLESEPADNDPSYLIEREEKLRQLACAAVLVDQHHANQRRSLRWDLLSARPTRGSILHAKISLLHWSRCVRLIVGSANLTEDGYRRNLEVFGNVDYFEGGDAPLNVLKDCVDFLRDAGKLAKLDDSPIGKAVGRWNDFLGNVVDATRKWGTATPSRSWGSPRVFAVFSRPKRDSVLRTLENFWPDANPPSDAYVISPFFDPPDSSNLPATQIWDLLRKRGDAVVHYHVTGEEVPGTTRLRLNAPKSLEDCVPAARNGVQAVILRLTTDERRPLHAKCLSLENERMILYMMGSSNFTSRGLGLSGNSNWEANLAYAVNVQQNRSGANALNDAWPHAEPLPDGADPEWQVPVTNEDEPSADFVELPRCFGDAAYSLTPSGGEMSFAICGEPPRDWVLTVEDEATAYVSAADWDAQGRPNPFRVSWARERPPYGFRVRWEGSNGDAWWGVNVESPDALPPPDELRNLPLDVLIDVLTSARPLHQALARWLRKRGETKVEGESMLDPHKRVPTATFLLQRTRRVSWALAALRERLERPVPSEAALRWRVSGPVGVLAVADAICGEARSEAEMCFLLAELCLELARVRPQSAPGCLKPKQVSAALKEAIQVIHAKTPRHALSGQPQLAAYTDAAFQEVGA